MGRLSTTKYTYLPTYLLPWRVQCPARVCAALRAGQRLARPVQVLLSPDPFVFPIPRMLQDVASGRPFPSPAGTPSQAVCALSGLCPVVHQVCAVCSLRVWALLHPRCARSPALVGVTRVPRAVPVQAAGGAVPGGSCPFAFPALVPCSAYLALEGWPGPRVSLPGPGSLAPAEVRPCVWGGLAPGVG